MTQRLFGKPVADAILQKVSDTCAARAITPGLAVILIGDDPASSIYVNRKAKVASELGFDAQTIRLAADTNLEGLTRVIDQLNEDKRVHGILLQLPIPKHLPTMDVLSRIRPDKDVDGFHPLNMGRLVAAMPVLAPPCTPYGVMALFRYYNINVSGKLTLVIGRSQIVGRPLVHMLNHANATVIWAHSRTVALDQLSARSDIVIAATGAPGLVKRHWLNEKSVAVDVGISKVDGKIVGDIDDASVGDFCAARTPVPGGVGPLTIAMLMRNTASLALGEAIEIEATATAPVSA